MNLTPQQLFVQDSLILASHPWLSFEEAKKREISKFWCILQNIFLWKTTIIWYWIQKPWYVKNFDVLTEFDWFDTFTEWDVGNKNIIWLPPTLPRVLNLLENAIVEKGWRWRSVLYRDETIYDFTSWDITDEAKICERKLLNEDWTPCNLRQQSEETQTAIALLLWWKDV